MLPRLGRSQTSADVRIGEEVVAQVGRSLTITGRLNTAGEIHVLGRIVGQITADRLFLAEGGFMQGDVVANDVQIAGRFNGCIYGRNVFLESSAEVTGRIFHNTITVAKGARIDGRIPWRPPNYFETLQNMREAQS